MVVTIPHKPAAAGLASIRSKRVEIAGAANVMRWTGQAWEADLFDGEGFLGGLERRGWPTAGRRAAIVGAGGAGLAIGAALLEAGAAQVSLDDIDRRQADRAVTRLAAHYGERVARGRPGAGHDLVVNATPMGMAPDDSPPIDLDTLSAGVLVADVIMKPLRTRLLLEAERRGMMTQLGAPMLDEQADMIWRFLDLDSGLWPAAAPPVESPLERNSAATKATPRQASLFPSVEGSRLGRPVIRRSIGSARSPSAPSPESEFRRRRHRAHAVCPDRARPGRHGPDPVCSRAAAEPGSANASASK